MTREANATILEKNRASGANAIRNASAPFDATLCLHTRTTRNTDFEVPTDGLSTVRVNASSDTFNTHRPQRFSYPFYFQSSSLSSAQWSHFFFLLSSDSIFTPPPSLPLPSILRTLLLKTCLLLSNNRRETAKPTSINFLNLSPVQCVYWMISLQRHLRQCFSEGGGNSCINGFVLTVDMSLKPLKHTTESVNGVLILVLGM